MTSQFYPGSAFPKEAVSCGAVRQQFRAEGFERNRASVIAVVEGEVHHAHSTHHGA
jgi:hypothetical protein